MGLSNKLQHRKLRVSRRLRTALSILQYLRGHCSSVRLILRAVLPFIMADSTDNQTREPQIQPYSRSFFDKDLQESRKSLRSLLILPMLYTTLLFWACLSLYWGSTVSSSLNKLSVSVTSLDDGSFGQNLLESIQTNSEQLVNTVNWHLDQNLLSDSGTRERVINEHIWASIQGIPQPQSSPFGSNLLISCAPANPNTSSNLQRAVNSAHPYSYNALSAVTIYFNSARNQITTNSKVVPAILAVLNPSLAELNARFVSSFLAANSYNATNISSALKCPACLSSPFAATQVDLRPFDLPQATGSTMVGMIFVSPRPHLVPPASRLSFSPWSASILLNLNTTSTLVLSNYSPLSSLPSHLLFFKSNAPPPFQHWASNSPFPTPWPFAPSHPYSVTLG